MFGLKTGFSIIIVILFLMSVTIYWAGNQNRAKKVVTIEKEIIIIRSMPPEMVKQKILDQLTKQKEEYSRGIQITW